MKILRKNQLKGANESRKAKGGNQDEIISRQEELIKTKQDEIISKQEEIIKTKDEIIATQAKIIANDNEEENDSIVSEEIYPPNGKFSDREKE